MPTTTNPPATPQLSADSSHPTNPLSNTFTLSNLPAQQIPWLWPDRFPLSQLSLLVSQPGVGKSLLTLEIAARVTTGAPFPDSTTCPNGSVLLVPREDDPNQIIRPRLEAAGADLSKIHILAAVHDAAKVAAYPEIFFNLRQFKPLEDALEEHPDCKLVVLDPIAAFFHNADPRHDATVRASLSPLFHLAQRHGVAFLIVHHLQKRPTRDADQSIQGGSSFASVCRNVWHLVPDTLDRDRRLLVPGKSNLTRRAPALAFTIATDPSNGAARVNWDHNPIATDADEALNRFVASRSGPEPLSRLAAQAFLTELLQSGPADFSEIKRNAHAAGVAERTLERAAAHLNIIRRRVHGNSWTWELPNPTPPPK